VAEHKFTNEGWAARLGRFAFEGKYDAVWKTICHVNGQPGPLRQRAGIMAHTTEKRMVGLVAGDTFMPVVHAVPFGNRA